MAAVTQIVPNFLGGVSKQTDHKKRPGQVRDCLNGYPDPTFGLMKRPGFKFIKTIYDSSPTLSDGKWFFIKRDNLETYIGVILDKADHASTPIKIWNKDGTACTIHWDALPWVANTAYAVGDKVTNDSNKVYVCDTAGTSHSSGGPTGTTATTNGITDGSAKWHYVSGSVVRDYLDETRDNYDVLTVQDTSIITNKKKVITKKTAPTAASYTAKAYGTIRLKQVAYSCKYKVSIKIGSTTYAAAEYTTVNSENLSAAGGTAAAPTPFEEKFNTADKILTELESDLDAFSSGSCPGTLTTTKLSASLELSYVDANDDPEAIEIIVSDNQGNTNIEAFTDEVATLTTLPAESLDGRKVKIISESAAEGNYWSKFKANNGTSGIGYWEESVDPTLSVGLNPATLPHELKNTATNTFVFQEAAWVDRTVGDDVTNSHPSFVDSTINKAFFHSNRLGFLSNDNVVLSKSNDFYNFYFTSALTLTDADPIDLNCSSVRPCVLHSALPVPQGLVLFSRNQQFLLGGNTALTPNTTSIQGISNYEMDTTIDPVDVGTSFSFISKTPSYSRIFTMQTRGQQESPEAVDIGKIVSEWLPDTITELFSSAQNSIIGLYGKTLDTIYLFKTYAAGNQLLMQAWFNWQLPGKIQHITTIDDTMWAVVEYNSQYVLCSASLTQTPDEKIIETSDGQRVNPHMDLYGPVSSMALAGDITSVDTISAADGNRTQGTYLIDDDDYTTDGTGTGAKFTVVVDANGAATVTVTYNGEGYVVNETITIADSKLGSGGGAALTFDVATITTGFTKCYLPTGMKDNIALNPVLLIVGNGTTNFAGVTESGFTITPDRPSGQTHATGSPFFKVPRKNISGLTAADVVVGYKYNYNVELPKTYFKLDPEGNLYDYSASLTIARMKFAVGLSSVCSFKLSSKGYRGEIAEFTGDGSTTAFSVPFLLKEENGIKVTLDGAKQASTDYTVTSNDTQSTVTFNTAPKNYTVKQLFGGAGYTAATGVATTSSGSGTGLTVNTTVSGGAVTAVAINNKGSNYKQNEAITISGGTTSSTFLIDNLPQTIKVTTDTWYDAQSAQDANQYLSDDVPLVEEQVFTVPIHQKSDNFKVKVFSNSPFPITLTSMMWEGNYSPRFYRRT